MTVVGVRELAKRASAIVDDVAVNNESAVITKRGKPVAVLLPIDSERLDDHLLATAPEFLAATAAADIELREGRTVALADVLADID